MSDTQSGATTSRNPPRRKRLANRPNNYEITFMIIVSAFTLLSITLNMLLDDSVVNTPENPSEHHPILKRKRLNNSKIKMTMKSSDIHVLQKTDQHTDSEQSSFILDNVGSSMSSHGRVKEVHKLGGLKCESHGGADDEIAVKEMVYWSDIPSDAKFVSPFKTKNNAKGGATQYMTFEPGTLCLFDRFSMYVGKNLRLTFHIIS